MNATRWLREHLYYVAFARECKHTKDFFVRSVLGGWSAASNGPSNQIYGARRRASARFGESTALFFRAGRR